ncbi:MAG: carbonate dehydratase, partial [Pusillimonas sp.]|nr:carbonate dehydratase [Pusillimonas sp.]
MPRNKAPDSNPPDNSTWHALSADDTRSVLKTSDQGLTESEATKRLQETGLNQLAAPHKRGALQRFFAQFHNILLYIMLVAAVVTAIFQHWIDTGVLVAAVVVNAVIGFIQEGKAESALDAIRNMLSPRATVIREGRRCEIEAANLVSGDLVVLNPGDRVPADIRLFKVKTLKVEEAALTGESVPVEKHADAVQADASLGDRYGMAYAGTLVVNGQATGWVVATGANTELGNINKMLAAIGDVGTPMMRQINHFSYLLALVILVVATLVFFFGTAVRGESLINMFMLVVALVAAAIPEGLPAIMTVTLALGVQRMARQHAIIRRL